MTAINKKPLKSNKAEFCAIENPTPVALSVLFRK